MTQKPSCQELEQRVQALEMQVEEASKNLRAEVALRDSESRFRTLFEFAPNPICLEDVESGAIEANRAMCELFGYTKKELLEKSFTKLMHPDDVEIWSRKRAQLLRGELSSYQLEKRYINKKGEVIWGITALSVLRNLDGAPEFFTVQIQNINHIKQLEEQLLQAQKMKAIGTLAGGIAHDFNNLLMGIQGRVSLLLLDADQNQFQVEHLKKIEDHIRRAANLTSQLLGFAREGKYALIRANINELVEHETRMFGRTRKDISIQRHFAPDLWAAKVDQAQFRQVLLNIFINAAEAMSKGGLLTVSTENVQLSQYDNKPIEVSPGHFIRISITDTGVGMDPVTRQRIFEPFFTTRLMGKGAGLGLASAYGIVRNHGGFINVYSEKGRGTTLMVFLPAMDQDTEMTEKKTLQIQKGQGVILLVDDEDMITEIGRQMIQRLGYTVLIADSGREAIHVYAENRDKIDLVILDMIMPEMSGEETFDELKSIDSEIKVILSSGYSIDGKASEILNRGGIGFIQKPFNMNQLAEALNSALMHA
jgi:two-component system, cell cycle sensor histidine kinase and response regulator CckA